MFAFGQYAPGGHDIKRGEIVPRLRSKDILWWWTELLQVRLGRRFTPTVLRRTVSMYPFVWLMPDYCV